MSLCIIILIWKLTTINLKYYVKEWEAEGHASELQSQPVSCLCETLEAIICFHLQTVAWLVLKTLQPGHYLYFNIFYDM